MSSKDLNLFSYNTLVHAVAGSVGSVVAMTVFYPLDTVRSRLQIEELESKNTWIIMAELVKEEGVKTLYRGLLPVLKSLWTSNFVYFYAFHGLKRFSGDNSAQSAGRDLMLATVAGVVNVLTTTPLWVVNTRLRMRGVKKQNTSYKGLLDGLTKISKEEGIRALWSGTIPSLILVSNPAIQFMVYEGLKRKLQELYPEKKFGIIYFFLIGALSKSIATVLTYSIQLIQTKLRHGHSYSDLSQNAGMIEVATYIFRKYGFKGLFKGMEAKILQTVLTSALMFATYEKIARFVFRIMKANKN